MSPQRHVTTSYAQYVFSNLPPIVRSGGGAYTYSELAGMVGLKPTQHFKRRVNELCELGKLVLIHSFTPRGGITSRFMTPIEQSELVGNV